MSIIPSLPVTLQNGTIADATQVMADLNSIVTNVNNNAANTGVNSNITSLLGLTTPLSASQGGIGVSAPTANCILIGEGSAPVNSVGPGAAGQVLVSNGPGADPSFVCPYAVGDLYLTTNNANPSARYVGTTWVAYAAGQVLIGVGSYTDPDGTTNTFAAGQQVGEYQHTLTIAEMPSHAHTDSGHTHANNATGQGESGTGTTEPTGASVNFNSGLFQTTTGYASLQNTGGGSAHNNIQPSIGVYIWQRTA